MVSLWRVSYAIKLFGLYLIGKDITLNVVKKEYVMNRFMQISPAAKDLRWLRKIKMVIKNGMNN